MKKSIYYYNKGYLRHAGPNFFSFLKNILPDVLYLAETYHWFLKLNWIKVKLKYTK